MEVEFPFLEVTKQAAVSKCLFCKATCCSLSFCLGSSALRENKKVSLLFLIEYKRYFFK